MFEKIWNQKTQVADSGGVIIERSNGDPLQFDGELHIESNGTRWADYRPSEPYHLLRVYKLSAGGFAVVVEFCLTATESLVDGELVSTVDELDDFFCIQAADHFMQFGAATGRQDPVLEQRVLARYDQQVQEVLSACALKCSSPVDAPIGRSPYGGWSTSPVAEADGQDV